MRAGLLGRTFGRHIVDAGCNDTPAVMANVQNGTAVKLDGGNPNMWFSASAADAILSVLSGKKAIEDAPVTVSNNSSRRFVPSPKPVPLLCS